MRPKRLKVRATPLDGHAIGRINTLKVLKGVTGLEPADISQEGEDIVLFFSCEEELEKLLTNDAILRKERHLHPHFPRQFLAGRTVFTSRTSRWSAE